MKIAGTWHKAKFQLYKLLIPNNKGYEAHGAKIRFCIKFL